MKQTILFDLDDTLIHCNRYFFMVIDQFASWMADRFRREGLDPDEVRRVQAEIDIAGVQVVGFDSEHFPRSFVETYRHFAARFGVAPSRDEEETVWRLGRSVYELEAEPYPHMEETLVRLKEEGHELHLYTGGDPEIQRRKIDRFGLRRFFGSRIHIRRHKNVEALEEIAASCGFDRSRTWMIGNSLRTDVIPALKAGLHAIHVQAEREWQYNIARIDVEPKGAFIRLKRLKDVPDAIAGYVRSHMLR
ncbi:MAG: HAD family hydrolase [Thermobacillus sp. ZCTH02-B1]|uniref:HAD family hydrolase n=1 Tax=Thermobacillus sp. ZCTH02-B1 TaxID=1858795 RepID=UPI000B57CC89|nr:HAD family hydrolase [Thermobacillus sp. ZCTH02-B1]OUM96662.1 MAG: HAD family hydrolase [Thermobacillus sp. ZCTH02-B1]